MQKILRDKKLETVDDNFDAEELDEEFPTGELETREEDLASRITYAESLSELQIEIKTLQRLTDVAKKLFQSGKDKKWNELSELLFYVETKISDGREQILSKRLHFVELSQTTQKLSTSPAPYLDYRSPNDAEREKIFPSLENIAWLNTSVEERAINFAAENILKPLQSKIAAQKKIFLDKLEREIKTRLGS